MDTSRLADLLRPQNFGPNDSTIASAINHPITASQKALQWLEDQVRLASNTPSQYDNPSPLTGYTPEQQAGGALNLAGLAQTSAMPFAPQVGRGTLGTMGGINATNAPKEQFSKAEELAKALKLFGFPVGSDDWLNANRDIWGKTGIHYGADNMPRFEIDDSGASYLKSKSAQKINDILDHGQVTTNYPSIKGIEYVAMKKGKEKASYSPENYNDWGDFYPEKIELNEKRTSKPELLSNLLHEVQHAIQNREGFSGGSNLKNSLEQIEAYNNKLHREIKDLASQYGWKDKKIDQLQNKLVENNSESLLDFYLKNAGEAEARAVQKRMNYTPEQRSQIFPLDDYDRNISDLIVRLRGNQ